MTEATKPGSTTSDGTMDCHVIVDGKQCSRPAAIDVFETCIHVPDPMCVQCFCEDYGDGKFSPHEPA